MFTYIISYADGSMNITANRKLAIKAMHFVGPMYSHGSIVRFFDRMEADVKKTGECDTLTIETVFGKRSVKVLSA